MSDEIESKFKVESFSAVHRALRAAGAKYVATVVQRDSHYDTPNMAMLGRDCCLRIRRVRRLRSAGPFDARPLLTVKGPRRPTGGAKVRPEFQIPLDEPDAAEKLLRAAGLREVLLIEKRRATYRLGRCEVALDELPVIGRFVEVEAPSAKALTAACRRLGLTGEPIAETYVHLLLARRKLAGARKVTFGRFG